jgi:mannose-1-phosphate guanylyltransferase/mannose-6-phosphate isomerase
MALVHPVILCGGAGARLWPRSIAARPKPFLDLAGQGSLLGQTVQRLSVLPDAAPAMIVVGASLAEAAAGEVAAAIVVAEPGPRGSAAAIAAAALELSSRESGAMMLILASDHHIPDARAFAAAIAAARVLAAAGKIVTFGVAPTSPSTAYGYVRPGEAGGSARFVEKPDTAEAADLIRQGWLWNSGNFLARADVVIEELGRHEPSLLAAVRRAVASGERGGRVLTLSPAFLDAPNLAFDVAVMERTDRAAVFPIAYAWSDLGTWDAVLAASPRDSLGNAVEGKVETRDCRDCLILGDAGARIVAVGLSEVAVVVEGNRILVCALDSAQLVKSAAEAMESGG